MNVCYLIVNAVGEPLSSLIQTKVSQQKGINGQRKTPVETLIQD